MFSVITPALDGYCWPLLVEIYSMDVDECLVLRHFISFSHNSNCHFLSERGVISATPGDYIVSACCYSLQVYPLTFLSPTCTTDLLAMVNIPVDLLCENNRVDEGNYSMKS